jgi:predicted GNAT family N-acyltransferase
MGNDDTPVPRFSPEQVKVSVRRIRGKDAESAFALGTRLIPRLADNDAVRDIYRKNPDTFWGIFSEADGSLLGFYSFLLLKMDGVLKLLSGEFDPVKPSADLIAAAGERPAAIYIWAVAAQGLTKQSGPLIINAMTSLYRGLPIYATAGTQAGLNKILSTGLRPVDKNKTGVGALYVYDAYAATEAVPSFTSRQDKLAAQVRVSIAATPDDIDKVRTIRAAVFMAEQDCPYEEEFDGNDFTCTHVLGYVDDEPAATLRIRYFAGFVKFERLALLSRFRRRTVLTKQVIEFAIEFCRRKGYTVGCGHAQKRLVGFWSRFGFRPTGQPSFVYSDHEYIEMRGEFPPHGTPITVDGPPYVILRPEGRWDEVGILERSAARPATNPVGRRA